MGMIRHGRDNHERLGLAGREVIDEGMFEDAVRVARHPGARFAPLHFLAAHTPDNRIAPKAMRGLMWMLEHGADPNVSSHAGRAGQPQAGEAPLHRAAAVGHGEAVLRALVEHGARVIALKAAAEGR